MKKIKRLADVYFSIEEIILSEIEELENSGNLCTCAEPVKFCVVDGSTITCYCLSCGGYITY